MRTNADDDYYYAINVKMEAITKDEDDQRAADWDNNASYSQPEKDILSAIFNSGKDYFNTLDLERALGEADELMKSSAYTSMPDGPLKTALITAVTNGDTAKAEQKSQKDIDDARDALDAAIEAVKLALVTTTASTTATTTASTTASTASTTDSTTTTSTSTTTTTVATTTTTAPPAQGPFTLNDKYATDPTWRAAHPRGYDRVVLYLNGSDKKPNENNWVYDEIEYKGYSINDDGVYRTSPYIEIALTDIFNGTAAELSAVTVALKSGFTWDGQRTGAGALDFDIVGGKLVVKYIPTFDEIRSGTRDAMGQTTWSKPLQLTFKNGTDTVDFTVNIQVTGGFSSNF